MIRRVVTVVAVLALGTVGISGCNWEHPQDRRFEACLEAGGSWITHAWSSPSCVLPEGGDD